MVRAGIAIAFAVVMLAIGIIYGHGHQPAFCDKSGVAKLFNCPRR